MPTAQPGIFAEGSQHHHFLELDLSDGADAAALCGALSGVLAGDVPDSNVVVAFGPDAWQRCAPGPVPAGLGAFAPIEGAGGVRAEATQHDLAVWVHGGARGLVFERALEIARALAPHATLAYEESAFVYKDSRDLTGFVDGSANPKAEKRLEAALVPDGAPGAGGSHVLLQRWVHDLPAFHALDVAAQERVIGRTKPDSVEFDDDAMPPDAHVARTDVSSAKLYRRSVPFGCVREHGLVFLAFSTDRARFELLLDRMFGRAEDGVIDRLLSFSRAVRGAYYFAPSVEELGAAASA